jgi:hypothetical protein
MDINYTKKVISSAKALCRLKPKSLDKQFKADEFHTKGLEDIFATALSYVGQQEIPGNQGFKNPKFEDEMTNVGWLKGEAWCATFAKLVFKKAYADKPTTQLELERLFSKSATQTYSNFDKSDWKTQNPDGTPIKKPVKGALAVWRHGDSWAGHIGIVIEVNLKQGYFKTIEGNTNAFGSREGIQVAVKERKMSQPYSDKGLNLIGFVYPK